MTANVYIDSFQRIQFYGKPDTNGNITPVANILASATGNLISYIPGENIEFTVDQATGNIHINAPSYSPVVDYWRTFRDFESNASIIADQAQDVVTFKGGDNIRLDFNEGDDIITWHADLEGAADSLKANLSVVNSNIELMPSMLDYDSLTGVFTYFPPDLSSYATFTYVDQSIQQGLGNIDLSEYATEKWVQGYIGTAINIPDTSDLVTKTEYNEDLALINEELESIANTAVGYTGSKGQDGGSVKIIGSVENYNVLVTLPRWTNYLGQVGDGVITEDNGNLVVATNLGPPTVWLDNIGPITGPPGNQGPRGYNGSKGDRGYTGSKGDIGYTGSQGIQGYTGSIGFTGSESTVPGPQGNVGFTGSRGNVGYTGSALVVGRNVFTQSVPSNLWVINHNMGVQYLSAEVVDDSGNSLVGTYSYPTITFVDDNTTTVSWSYATTGKLILVAGAGPKGDQGNIGPIGYTGSQGPIGFTGSTGAFAAVGFTGSKGAQGFSGSAGPQGFTGSAGTTMITTVYTFANLPTGVSAGARAFISDSSIPPQGNYGQPAQSGGTDLVPVFYTGLIWLIG